MYKIKHYTIVITFLFSTGYNLNPVMANPDGARTFTTKGSLSRQNQESLQSEIEKTNALFEKIFMDGVMRSPISQSYLGIKKDNDKWDDFSEIRALEDHKIDKMNLEKVKAIDISKLDEQTKVSLRLQRKNLQNNIDDFKWRHHNYPFNQMFGIHSMVPSLLINQHTISDVKDARAYISRLNGISGLFDQAIDGLHIREEKGIIPPKFVFPHVINSSQNILTGAPFDEGDDSTLLADFKSKVTSLDINKAEKDKLIASAIKALKTEVKQGYTKLISALKKVEKKADNRAGAWKFPDGKAFFNNALTRTTTTNLSASEIHNIGLSEVSRIHDEMREIVKKVKFSGDFKAFFEYMRVDKQFFYDETKAGRDKYLSEAIALINNMKSRLDELFIVKPKAELVVKAVEAFREKSAGKAFYQRPSMDGSRPGKYYVNLYRMSDMPTYQMEALAYHEGLPGHHMQLAIAGELGELPKFRRFGGYTAYIEGWGLYSEQIPKEIGLYQDPYSDFGRLAMELWRACRLVVDTGIHAMGWNREQGIDYYMNNTPNPRPDVVKMVERHIVFPSQATAYKIGMLKILKLREHAKQKMGDRFDIRKFHDVVLKNGPVPLTVLEEFVTVYIESDQIK